jgi:hypothetical protein
MIGCESPMNGPQRYASVTRIALTTLLTAIPFSRAVCQTQFYNLDSNRPLRVEDAVPTERRSLDIQFAPLRLDELTEGRRRWRMEPKLSYGIAALTEVEVRLPVLVLQPGGGGPTTLGLTTIGIGGMHAFSTETSHVPALALSGEVLPPIGLLAPPRTSYAIKGLLTKTAVLGRLSVNAAYGTYSVIPAAPVSATCRLLPPGAPGCNGQPSIPDVPCTRVAAAGVAMEEISDARIVSVPFAPRPATACLTTTTAAAPAPRTIGTRWFAGAAIDHTFALSSTLVGADLFAERFIGLTPLVDWTAEVGLRHQWSPFLVLDAGVARHFAGFLLSTSITLGATYAVPVDWGRS